MKIFEIVMPIAGVAYAEVKAESEEEALSIFEDNWPKAVKLKDVDIKEGIFSITSLEAYETIAEGNVLHVDTNKLSITEMPETTPYVEVAHAVLKSIKKRHTP